MQTTVHQNNNARAGGRDYIENQQIFNCINLSSNPIKKESVKFKARLVENYNPKWALLKDIIFLALLFICVLVILPIDNKPSLFLLISGAILSVFMMLYYRLYKSIEINLDKIKIDDKLLHFKDIREINSKCIKFPVPQNVINIFLHSDSVYASYQLYLDDEQTEYIIKVWNQHLNEYIKEIKE